MHHMTKIYRAGLPLIIVTGLVLSCLWLPGCVFDRSGLPPESDWYQCSADLWHCQRLADAKPDLYLLQMPASSADLKASANAIQYPLMADKTKSYALYHDKNVVIYAINDELKGSLLIPTGFSEWKNGDEHYWGIEFNKDVGGLFVAYDSRATPPAWLKKDFTLYRDQFNSQAVIKTSLLDPSQVQGSGHSQFLTLDLYRYSKQLKSGSRIFLPGNSFDEIDANKLKKVKDWKEIKKGDPLMYAVLITPKTNWDCSGGYKVVQEGYEYCYERTDDAEQRAEYDAVQSWNRDYPFLAQKNINCSTKVSCADHNTRVGGGLTVKPRAYIYSSEIQFVSPSSAKVTIDGNSYNQSVNGSLHFEYLLKTHDFKLNSMHLFVDPLSTNHGHFSDIVIYLLETVMAQCKSGFTVPDMPCNQYELKPSTLYCAENFKRNGKPHLFISENSTPMGIAIDHPTRTFTIKGNLSSSAQVNGDTLPIDVDLNLVGKFVNFAPVPVGDESDTFSQCAEGTNMNPIHLNAAGSYDVYEPLPTYQAAYKWIEDFGLLTEKTWGQGKLVTIGKDQLSFGAHDITLLVEDAHGVAADTKLQVAVADTVPPSLTIPSDIMMFSLNNQGSVQVNIGTAYANDMCSSQVMVTNNAPVDMLFPDGRMTEVTWRAEDLRGNAASGIQRIYLMVLKPFQPQLEKAVDRLKELIQENRLALIECGETSQCSADVLPLIRSVNQLLDLSVDPTLSAQEKNTMTRIAAQLKPVRNSLMEGRKNLERSNSSEAKRSILRKSALNSMDRAFEQISKVQQLR
jgi:HYR domain